VLATAYLIGIRNEANAALVGGIGDGPLKKHREPIPETDEHQYVNEEPGEPGQQAVKPRGRLAAYPAKNAARRVRGLPHRHLRDAGE